MRSTLFVIFYLLAISTSNAQGFGGVQISNEFSPNGNQLVIGGGGAWVINEHFYLGGAGYGSLNAIITDNSDTVEMGYGGVVLGYLHNMQRKKSLGMDMMLGHGEYKVNEKEYDLFIIEPNLKFWYQFSDYIFGTLGIYYRISYPEAIANLQAKDLNRLGIRLTLNFGSLN